MKAKFVNESLNEVAEEKDLNRIKDIFKKGQGSDEKVLRLTANMAKSIIDPAKALRRAEAAWKILGKASEEYPDVKNEIADIFIERYKELTGHDVSDSDLSIEEKNKKPSSFKVEDVIIPEKNVHGEKGTIFLPTYSAIALWNFEIRGQLSDGAWENSRPYDHWKFWCDLETSFGKPETFAAWKRPKKTGYGLGSLIQYVGDRMVKYGRFGKAIGKDILNMTSSVDTIIELFPEEGPFEFEQWKMNQIRSTSYLQNDYYWKGLEQKHIDAYYSTKYNERDMRKDLSIISSAMHNVVH